MSNILYKMSITVAEAYLVAPDGSTIHDYSIGYLLINKSVHMYILIYSLVISFCLS